MSRSHGPEHRGETYSMLDIMEPAADDSGPCSCERSDLDTTEEDSSNPPRLSKDTCWQEVTSMQSLLLMTSEAIVKNLFGYYELGDWLDDAKIDLFLRLGVLDMGNNDACSFGPSDDCFRSPSNYLGLCEAFQAFYFYAEDPIYEELQFRLAMLYKYTACDRHRTTIQTSKELATQRIQVLVSWRELHFEETLQRSDSAAETAPPIHSKRQTLLTKMVSAPDFAIFRDSRKGRKDRRVSGAPGLEEQRGPGPSRVPITRPAPLRRTLSTSSAGSSRADSLIEEPSKDTALTRTREALEGISTAPVSNLPYQTEHERTGSNGSRMSIWSEIRGWGSKRKHNRQ